MMGLDEERGGLNRASPRAVSALNHEGAVLCLDVAGTLPQYRFFLPFLARPPFDSLTAAEVSRSKVLRDQLYNVCVPKGDGMRDAASLFVDFVCDCQRAALKNRPRRPPLLSHHVSPPASYDSTCPILFVDGNMAEKPAGGVGVGRWRTAYHNAALQDLEGLAELPISGSNQFGATGLQNIAKYIQTLNDHFFKVIVVDLRQEPHCFIDLVHGETFGDGSPEEVIALPFMAACWMTHRDFGIVGLSDEEGLQFEKILQSMLMRQVEVKLGWPHNSKLPSGIYTLKSVTSEKALVRQHKFKYKRLYVTDHVRPWDRTVQEFVDLVARWHGRARVFFHFHCHGGKGRTTTFMCMYDMLINAPKYPHLKPVDFVHRHKLLSKYDLGPCTQSDENLKFKQQYALHRYEFLELFHLFCTTNPLTNEANSSWTTFLRKKDLELDEKSPML